MQLHIKILGWSRVIEVCETDTIGVVRQKIAQVYPETGFTEEQVQLHFAGKVLEVGQLKDHQIRHNDELFVVITKQQELEITVLHGKARITLCVDPTETVENLKRILCDKVKVSVGEMRLRFQQKDIEGGQLKHYEICHGAMLELLIGGIQIFVKDTAGKTHTFDVKTSDTVEHLQTLVRGKTGVLESQQRLEFGGKPLQAGRTLGFYHIQAHSTIHMNMRLRGGYNRHCVYISYA